MLRLLRAVRRPRRELQVQRFERVWTNGRVLTALPGYRSLQPVSSKLWRSDFPDQDVSAVSEPTTPTTFFVCPDSSEIARFQVLLLHHDL